MLICKYCEKECKNQNSLKNNYLVVKDKNKIERVSQQNNAVVEIVTYENITKEYIQKALLV